LKVVRKTQQTNVSTDASNESMEDELREEFSKLTDLEKMKALKKFSFEQFEDFVTLNKLLKSVHAKEI